MSNRYFGSIVSNNQASFEVISFQSENIISLDEASNLTIGSGTEANLKIDDLLLDPVHFIIEQTESGILLRDVSNWRGVTLNGKRVQESLLYDQDRILVGFTQFIVHLPENQALNHPSSPLLDLLKSHQPLYALLDAARDRAILNCLEKFDAPFVSLFDGRRAEEYASAAPYLVRLDVKEPLIEALSTQGLGHSWGVYCVSPVPFEMLCKHLRNLLYANTPDGVLFFRFYDPRVLRKFLPHYDIEMAEQFFGSVEAFLVEAEDPGSVLRFTLGENGVECETILLSRVNPSGAQQRV